MQFIPEKWLYTFKKNPESRKFVTTNISSKDYHEKLPKSQY